MEKVGIILKIEGFFGTVGEVKIKGNLFVASIGTSLLGTKIEEVEGDVGSMEITRMRTSRDNLEGTELRQKMKELNLVGTTL